MNARLNAVTIDHFCAEPGQAWCLIGGNRSGMDDFCRLFSSNPQKTDARVLDLPEDLVCISFEAQQALYEEELAKDDTDFLDKIDPGTKAGSFLDHPENHMDLIETLGMDQSLSKGYRQLSTGQSRKLMLLGPITRGSGCLVIQSPFDGLDQDTCRELDQALYQLHLKNMQLILLVNNTHDIPDWCTHIGIMADHRLKHQGKRADILPLLTRILTGHPADFKPDASRIFSASAAATPDTELVRLQNGCAGYGGMDIFKEIDLKICQGEHTLVTGPNGCGKSTLLQIITGDHPACYKNDLRIFGTRRGTGESIWDLKKHMGIVSSELHRNYYVPGTALHCILSGLFDSIGLYRDVTAQDEDLARKWLGLISMEAHENTAFRELDYAAQRLVLIARALIKGPRLLILDEPTQGLDEMNRNAILDFLARVAKDNTSTILYVSHRTDEFRSFFRQHLELGD